MANAPTNCAALKQLIADKVAEFNKLAPLVAFYNKQAVIAQQKAQQQQMALDKLADAIKQMNAKYQADCGGKSCRSPKSLTN